MKLTLKACRTNVSASATELAQYVGVSKDTILNWEKGKSSPTIENAKKIISFFNSKGFDISIDDVIFLP